MKIQKPILSICIPTYNRADYLAKTLKSIVSVIPDKTAVEIAVSDNNSSDSTDKVIKDFKNYNPDVNLVYKKQAENIFLDRNILQSIEISTGRYCWLLSDDDVPLKGSINKILKVIKDNPDTTLIHLNYSRFDKKLNKVTSKRMVGSIKKDMVFNNYEDFFFKSIENSYFKRLGTNVITMSTDVLNKKRWSESVISVNKYIDHNFIHCFVIGDMILKSPYIYYIAKPQVQYLANNHRIWSNNIWEDYSEVLLGYLESIGYSRDEIEKMREGLRINKQRESIMKMPMIKYCYRFFAPILAIARKVRSDYLIK